MDIVEITSLGAAEIALQIFLDVLVHHRFWLVPYRMRFSLGRKALKE
jgi:hypothetical protein